MLKRKHWVLILLTPLVVLADQVTKTIALKLLESQTMTLIPSYFNLVLVKNTGMAFGLFNNLEGAWRTPLFVGISCIAILIIFHLLRQARPSAFLLPLSLSLILSGAVGNLIDRFRWGYVVDFINLHYHGRYQWPTFNLADAAITVGIILLIFDTLFTPSEKGEKVQESPVAGDDEPSEKQIEESA